MLKENKGITLVALVVTIIVLLILAGVTISLVLGQQGIFNKAGEAKTKTAISDATSAIRLAVLEAKTDTYDNKGVETKPADAKAAATAVVDKLKAAQYDATAAEAVITVKTTAGDVTATVTADFTVTITEPTV